MKPTGRRCSPRASRVISSAPCGISRSIAVLLGSSLLLGMLTPLGLANGGRMSFLNGRTQEGVPSAIGGAPEGTLPNLDEVRYGQLPQPIAPPSVPSTMRSRQNPLAPRIGIHFGDPLPSPSPSPSTSPSPSPSLLPSPSPSPLPSPSVSPLPSPSTSPMPSPMVQADGSTTTEWTKRAVEIKNYRSIC